MICENCGSNDFRGVYANIVKCTICGHYTSEMPSHDEDEYFESDFQKIRRKPPKRQEDE